LSKVRTSPDHGTAFDIAGKDMADYNSFKEAVYLAIDVYRRIQYQEIRKTHCELEKIIVNKKRQIRLLDL
jgi:4-hydroxythreonine-4-phosphate dehydrogenase